MENMPRANPTGQALQLRRHSSCIAAALLPPYVCAESPSFGQIPWFADPIRAFKRA